MFLAVCLFGTGWLIGSGSGCGDWIKFCSNARSMSAKSSSFDFRGFGLVAGSIFLSSDQISGGMVSDRPMLNFAQ